MAKDPTIEVSLNLLTFLEADEGWIFGREGKCPTVDEVLKFLCPPGFDASPEKIVERYRDLAGSEQNKLAILPAEHRILKKMVLPLRAAIGSYMVGNHLGTIAICGTVCEMLAIFWYELAQVRASNIEMDKTVQKKMYGDTFEKLGQSRRIDVMRAVQLIDENTERLFRIPLTIRRKHLHFFSHPVDDIAQDAKEAWEATRDLMTIVFRIEITEPGMISLDKSLRRYLEEANAEKDQE